MADMLVKLYDIAELRTVSQSMQDAGIDIRVVIAPEKHIVTDWVHSEFGPGWASECEVAFSNHPPSCIIAVCVDKLVGFACYNSMFKGGLGPIGVLSSTRMRGVGRSLLLASVNAMHSQGYAYAIIGDAGPEAFFTKAVGAIPIKDSSPGPYKGRLNR